MTFDEFAVEVLGPDTDAASFATQSFVGLGGDSLRAMRLVAMAQDRAGVKIPVAALLSDTPLADVLADAGAVVPAKSVLVSDAQASDTTGLSHAQRGMWLIERVTGGSPYNLVFTCHVRSGQLAADLFDRAIAETVARHEGLRTVFREQDDDVVPDVLDTHIPEITVVVDHDGTAADFDEFVRRAAVEHGRLPFDLAAAPAFRFLRVSHPAGRQAVVLMAHHMVLDGWSVGLLLNEVFTHYDALAKGVPDPLSEPAPGRAALVRFQESSRSSGEWDQQAEFWTKHLDGVPSVLELPADRPRPGIQDAAGERAALDFGADVTVAVLDRARELGITPFAFLLGAFGLTLSRWTGARRLLVGVPLTGRGTAELEELVAVAGNLAPVRIDVEDDAPIAEYLRAVHGSLALSIDNGALPFEELVSRLGIERSLGCHPLVQVCFGMHDQLVPQRISAHDAEIEVEEGHGGGAQFDLSLLVRQSDPSLAGHLEYATAVWGPAEVEGFLADFRAAAEQLATADGVLEEVRCLAPERRVLLERINETRTDFPETSLEELFRDAAQRTPDAIAVREGDVVLTYRQLAGAAAEQARLLRAAGVGPGDRVLVGLDRSVAEIVAVLGVVWAGAAYVGIDLSLPAAHTAQILERATPAAALVEPWAEERLQDVAVVATWDPSWPEDVEIAAAATDPGRVAYVAFTSGSTGRPKGVSVPHRAVIRLIHEADYVRLGAGERMLRLSPLAFDASTLELWGALLTGATLEVYPAGLPSPTELGEFLVERGVTVGWLTAGLFRLVEEFAPHALSGMRQLLTGGDVVPHDHAARALERHPDLIITNGYGPTENTTFTTTHTVRTPSDIDGPLPIGKPIPGTRVYVLDERRRLVPPGAVGELYAGGAGLADGYLGDDAETARSFGEFSPDVPERLYRTGDLVRIDTRGRVCFLGRRDDQVKLRGYRIELSAISDALAEQPGVQDAVVVVTDGDSAEKRLLAAVVPAAGAEFAATELRTGLAQRLPSYMVPTLWAVVDRIPVTGNGKVDRRALAAVAKAAGQARTPELPKPVESTVDDLLTQLTALFSEAMDKSADGIAQDTDFFTVGGNSMGAVRLVRLVRDRLGVTLKLRDFLRTPTPSGLTLLVEKAGMTRTAP